MFKFISEFFRRRNEAIPSGVTTMDADKERTIEEMVLHITRQLGQLNENELSLSRPQQLTLLGYTRGFTDIVALERYGGQTGAAMLMFLKLNEHLTESDVDPSNVLSLSESAITMSNLNFLTGAKAGAADAYRMLAHMSPEQLARALRQNL